MESEQKEASNLQSISWYLDELSARALSSGLNNSEQFTKAAKAARESLDTLIELLKSEAT